MDRLKTLGADRLRITVLWSAIAPDLGAKTKPAGFDGADPGAYPSGVWNNYDTVVRLAAERGLGVNFNITVPGPLWATGASPRADIANRYAPQHLVLHNQDSGKLLPEIKHAGTVYVGPWTPQAAGNYASGGNHILPTHGYTRAYGGVNVLTYMKPMTVQRITKDGIKRLGPTVIALAEGEGMPVHAATTALRVKEK